MDYMYAALLLNETGEELNETNLTAVLEAAGGDVVESRVRALVAALEDVDLDDVVPAMNESHRSEPSNTRSPDSSKDQSTDPMTIEDSDGNKPSVQGQEGDPDLDGPTASGE